MERGSFAEPLFLLGQFTEDSIVRKGCTKSGE